MAGAHVPEETALEYGNVTDPMLVRVLDEIIFKVLCSGIQARFDYLLNWAAHLVQHIGLQTRTFPVLWGTPGSGKEWLFKFLAIILGVQHCTTAKDVEQITGHFNDHLRNQLLLFMDEVDFSGAKGKMGDLRHLLTEPTPLYTKKGCESKAAPSHLNAAAATNEHPGVLVQPGERRTFVYDSTKAKGMSKWKRGDRLAAWNMAPYHLAKVLYSRDISEWDPERLPPNDNLAVM